FHFFIPLLNLGKEDDNNLGAFDLNIKKEKTVGSSRVLFFYLANSIVELYLGIFYC
ncbi:hypothetical protein ABID28_001899, partial [Streptococcus porcorum]